MKHIKGLDTFRALSVFFVIVGHWPGHKTDPSPVRDFIWEYIVPDGHSSVDFFFVLSGFLITSILLAAKEGAQRGQYLSVIGNFSVRRALRIFPAYYLMVFSLLIIGYEGIRQNLPWYLTYTSNILFFSQGKWAAIGHTWSLAVEEQFYLVWPWLILFVNNKYLKYVFISCIVVSSLSNYICYFVIDRGMYPLLVTNCLECFAFGAIYAQVRQNPALCKKFERWLLPVFLIILVTYFKWRYNHDQFWQYTNFLFRVVEVQVL